jgi:branched-chain amino acid transport system permease protein
VIIGGLGSLIGAYMGAAFIWSLPVIIRAVPELIGLPIGAATLQHVSQIIIGALIIFFLIVEPHGLARLWQIGKQKLRVWPFPY